MSIEFTTSVRNYPTLARFLSPLMVVLLTLRADCSLFAPKPAQPSRFLPLLHYDKMSLAWAVFIEVVAHCFFACAQPELLVGYQAARPTHQSLVMA